ncbi:hypothetical protein Ahy_A01g003383 [Arachis hypogaea]|uniref:Uncharacterized protein n=1 Tax=Arachis hypogaea TaxID=3818 RepID=A0A445ETA4_ARAHY|nr:hypothetical protein Ahy_A01g003383 [Arachis hypogaea]
MNDRVRLKMYYHGQILLQTFEGVKFVGENPLDVVIPFTLSFEELKGVICEKKNPQIRRGVSCILYRYSVSVFGGFVQFQTKYVTDEASMQEMFSVYLESRSRISFIELYVEFEQSAADRDIELEDYNSDSEEDFESNYEVVDSGVDEDHADDAMVADVADMTNALANQQPFEEPTFMRSLDLEACTRVFSICKCSSREAVIKAMKDYTIRIGVDYRVHESEPTTFYAKCTQYGAGYDWLIRVSKMSRKYYWEIRKYNGSHTCTRATISQNHSKLDSNTIAEAIKPLVEVDPSIKLLLNPVITMNIVYSRSFFIDRILANSSRVRDTLSAFTRVGEAYTNWLDRILCEQYVLAFDAGYRWGHMTTNLVECINSVLKGARNLPVTALVKTTFYRLNELFTRKMECVSLRAPSLKQSINQCRLTLDNSNLGNVIKACLP